MCSRQTSNSAASHGAVFHGVTGYCTLSVRNKLTITVQHNGVVIVKLKATKKLYTLPSSARCACHNETTLRLIADRSVVTQLTI